MKMNKTDVILKVPASGIDGVVNEVKQFLSDERGSEYPTELIRKGISEVLYSKFDLIAEDLREMFTSPQNEEVRLLEQVLARQMSANVSAADAAMAAVAENIFNGERKFSAAKYSAMMEYILSKGHLVYKTNLNKLLFYSDMTAFYLNGRGISGAVYLHRPFGPVADPAAEIFDGLVETGRVKVADRTKHFEVAAASTELLDDDDIKALDWVLETYGQMGAREISDLSHNEIAYRDTKPNEPIAYAYAKFLKTLPPKGLLGN